MKLYYKINKISSATDTIKVDSYGNTVFEFHKEDFGDNWEALLHKEYELNPYEIASLDKLQLTGEEEHPIEYSERDKINWYDYSRNMIRDDFLDNQERLLEVNTSKPVVITNKNPITSSTELISLLNKIHTYFYTTYKIYSSESRMTLDLSKLIFSDKFADSDFGNSYACSILSYADVIRVWNLPKSITSAYKNSYSCYSDHLENLIDITNIDTSNVVCMHYMFQNATNIKDIRNLSFKNAQYLCSTFKNSGVEFIPEINDEIFPKCIYFDTAFSNCKNLKRVGDISLSNNVLTNDIFNGCSNLEKIGNINLPNVCYTSNLSAYVDIGRGIKAEIGNIYAPKANVYLSGGKIGNVTADTITLTDNIISQPNEVGVINCAKLNSSNRSTYMPFKIKAMSNKLSMPIPTSTGYEHWVDIEPTNNTYRKSILTPSYGIICDKQHIKVYKKNATFKIRLPILDVNKEYPYNFELQTVDVQPTTINSNALITNVYTSSDLKTRVDGFTVSSISYSAEDKALIMTASLSNIEDDREIFISLTGSNSYSIVVKYTALIDGWPFSSTFTTSNKFKYYIPLSFEVDEDISGSTRVVYDEDEVVEETPAEEIVEDTPKVDETVNESTEN